MQYSLRNNCKIGLQSMSTLSMMLLPPSYQPSTLYPNATTASNDGIDMCLDDVSRPAAVWSVDTVINCHFHLDDRASNTRSFSGCLVTAPSVSTLHQHPFAHHIHTTLFAGSYRYCNGYGWFGWPTPIFIQLFCKFFYLWHMYFHHYEWLCQVWIPNTH